MVTHRGLQGRKPWIPTGQAPFSSARRSPPCWTRHTTGTTAGGPDQGFPATTQSRGTTTRFHRKQRDQNLVHLRPGAQRRTPGCRRQIRRPAASVSRSHTYGRAEIHRISGREEALMSTHSYGKESFLTEFFREKGPEGNRGRGAAHDRSRPRYPTCGDAQTPGPTQARIAERTHVRQERVSALERAEITVSELRTLAAHIEAHDGRMDGDHRRLRRGTTRRPTTEFETAAAHIRTAAISKSGTSAGLVTRRRRFPSPSEAPVRYR